MRNPVEIIRPGISGEESPGTAAAPRPTFSGARKAARRGVKRPGAILAAILAAALPTACYDSRFPMPGPPHDPPAATTTLAHLRTVYAGTPFTVTGEVVVRGVVTTDDRAGNFYRSFCIEDDGAALEVMAGEERLYLDYPAGSRVTVRLRGLTLGESRGVLQAGTAALPGSGYPTGYIASRPALDAVLFRDDGTPAPVRATPQTPGRLSPALCGTLVRIEGLRYAPDRPGPSSWGEGPELKTAQEEAVRIFVRRYADFADEAIPSGWLAVTGILQKDGNGYLLKPRSRQDIAPYNPPVILE